jgi:hypothetical protein
VEYPKSITFTNRSAASSADFIGNRLAGPFTMGVSTNPGQMDTALIVYLWSVGRQESKIIRMAILDAE